MKDYNYSKDETISQYFFEGEMARAERHVKRWVIVWIITFATLILSNVGWLYYENQFQDVVTTQTVEQDSSDGGINKFEGDFYGGDYYGETEDNKNRKETSEKDS